MGESHPRDGFRNVLRAQAGNHRLFDGIVNRLPGFQFKNIRSPLNILHLGHVRHSFLHLWLYIVALNLRQ